MGPALNPMATLKTVLSPSVIVLFLRRPLSLQKTMSPLTSIVALQPQHTPRVPYRAPSGGHCRRKSRLSSYTINKGKGTNRRSVKGPYMYLYTHQLTLDITSVRISHHHYAVRIDTDNFYKSTLLEIAMSSDDKVLLYAIVAFAAYHRTFEPEINEILPFLSHYNKAIVLLQQSLTRQGPNITILLAILQLTTIEVCRFRPKLFSSCSHVLCSNLSIGISRRLGNTYGAPESMLSYYPGSVHTRDDSSGRDSSQHTMVLHAIRYDRRHDIQRSASTRSRVV